MLIIADELDENLYLATRNLINIAILDATGIDPVSLVNFEHVFILRDAFIEIEKTLFSAASIVLYISTMSK